MCCPPKESCNGTTFPRQKVTLKSEGLPTSIRTKSMLFVPLSLALSMGPPYPQLFGCPDEIWSSPIGDGRIHSFHKVHAGNQEGLSGSPTGTYGRNTRRRPDSGAGTRLQIGLGGCQAAT